MLTEKTKSKYVDGLAAICSMKLYSKKQRSVTGHIKTINRMGDDRCVPEENKSCYQANNDKVIEQKAKRE